jgi:hypothetical protein
MGAAHCVDAAALLERCEARLAVPCPHDGRLMLWRVLLPMFQEGEQTSATRAWQKTCPGQCVRSLWPGLLKGNGAGS